MLWRAKTESLVPATGSAHSVLPTARSTKRRRGNLKRYIDPHGPAALCRGIIVPEYLDEHNIYIYIYIYIYTMRVSPGLKFPYWKTATNSKK